MTIRHLRALLAAAVVVLTLFGFAGAAGAQEAEEEPAAEEGEHSEDHGELIDEVVHVAEENGATHADAECIHILAEGGTLEECYEAPNPLLPETNEIIWGGVGFIVVLVFLSLVGYPAIKKSMQARTDRIKADLDAAEAAKVEAQSAASGYESTIAEARTEGARIIEEARQAADALKRDAEARQNAELAEARTRALADIEAQKGQAMAELRGDVTSIALGAAEAVVGRSLDRAAQTQLIDEYINRVGSAGQN